MLRIGVIANSEEIEQICAAVHDNAQTHLIGVFAYDNPEIITNQANFLSVEELLTATDSVFISSKAAQNLELVEKAIKYQVHTFVEFPFIVDAEQGNKLMNLAHEANIKLQVSNPLKYTPVFMGLQDKFKQPVYIESHQMQSISGELTSTSVIQNLMIRDIDLILSIVGSDVKKVSANGVAVVNGTPDIVNARIEFENGCIANLTTSRISFQEQHRMRFFQRNSYISADFIENEAHIFEMEPKSSDQTENLLINLGKGGQKEVFYQHPDLTPPNPIHEEIKLFAKTIEENSENHSTISNALKSIEITELIAEKVLVSSKILE